MDVDEAKDRVVIHDLDAELAEIEATEPKTMFIPDIDKKVSAIPQHILQNQSEKANYQLVLYRVPNSISIPEEKDAVRKAIIAARARAREGRAHETERESFTNKISDPGTDGERPSFHLHDPDAMDIG